MAFFITEYESPLDISPTEYPSFWACFILEFIKTVHLEPKSTGFFDFKASCTNSFISNPKLFAKVSINEPHPEEQASLSIILSIAPFLSLIYFISCPPISTILVTSGSNSFAAV